MSTVDVVRLVAAREFYVRLRSRTFLISTAVILSMIAGLVILVSFADGEDSARLELVGPAEAATQSILLETADSLDIALEIERFPDRSTADEALTAGAVDAVLVGHDELRFGRELDPRLALIANRAVRESRLPEQLDALGLTLEQAEPLLRPEPLPEVGLLDPDEDDARGLAATIGPVVLLMAMLVSGTTLLSGVIEEKTSRVVEVLLGTLRPVELLFGKMIAILALGLLQLTSVIAVGGVLAIAVLGSELPDVSAVGVASAMPWFVLGFLFYGTAFAAVGASVGRQEDAEATAMPLIIVMAIAELASIIMIDNQGPVTILALLPFTAPMAMPSLIALGDAAPWLIAVSVLTMLASTAGMLWIGARLYGGAVLRIGPRVSFFDAWRVTRGCVAVVRWRGAQARRRRRARRCGVVSRSRDSASASGRRSGLGRPPGRRMLR